jgi:Carboxypeptidase regulatory-like domain
MAMRRILASLPLSFLLGAAAALAACNPAGGPASTGAGGGGGSEGTTLVTGRATAGPTCPVERNPPDPNCAERPVAGAVMVIEDSSGAEVQRATTNADGSFTVQLAPGSYRLVPQPVSGLMGGGQPVAFTIQAGTSPEPLQVSYDTGIR